MDIFHSLVYEPILDLEVRDDRGSGSFSDCHAVPDVVTVAVRDEDVVGFYRISPHRCQWVAGEKGIGQQLGAVGLD